MPFKSALTLIVDGESFPASDGDSPSSGLLTWSDPGLTWAVGDTVSVSLKATIPGAPTNFSGTAGNGEATLDWTNPGDATITKYQYRQKKGSGGFGNWTDITGSGATTVAHTVTGLTGGTAYTFQVRAVSAVGPGAATDTLTVIPDAAAPGAPPVLSVGGRDESALLFWSTAKENGAAITKYQYQQDGGAWIDIDNSSPGEANELSFTVTGLTNGATYAFKVRAVNSIGAGAETGETSAIPAGVPLAPTDFRATEGDESAILSWTAAANNGAAITKYQYQQDGGNWNDIGNSAPGEANALSFTVTSLTNGATYAFKVRAVNSQGAGAETTEETATPRTVPGAAWNVAAAPSDGGALLTWQAPSADGGAPITGYEWDGDDSGVGWLAVPGDGATRSYLVTGLTNGTSYTLKVRAVNAAGVGPETAAPAVTPNAPAAKPTGLAATANRLGATLSWTDPSDSTITAYQFRQSADGGNTWNPDWTPIAGSGPTTAFHPVTGLVNGIRYTFQLRAMRGNVAGVASESVTVTAVLPPAKPANFKVTEGDGQVTLTWDDPRDTTIGKYQYQQSEDGGSTWNPGWTDIPGSDATTTAYTVTGLANGIRYTFQLRAMQGDLAGVSSDSKTAAPVGPAAQPNGLTATASSSAVQLIWKTPAMPPSPRTRFGNARPSAAPGGTGRRLRPAGRVPPPTM